MIAKLCANCLFYMPDGMKVIDSSKCFVCGKNLGKTHPMVVWQSQLKDQQLWARTSGMMGEYSHSEILDEWRRIIFLEYEF